MRIKHIAKIKGGQDGVVWNNYLFRFNGAGVCYVYDIKQLNRYASEAVELKEISTFSLDRIDELKPHSNAVMFGKEFYSPDDEFPLLYTNIYNNYSGTDNPLKGVCLVYRLQRNGMEFSSTLVQIIEIGFVEDSHYWKSCEDEEDVRPYGNFTIDAEKGTYYAFTMRDKENTTRYFSFDLPKLSDGEKDEIYNVSKVTLSACDIKEYFDCEYHRFIQGAAFYNGKIYSLEGFTNSQENPPAMRIIDVKEKKQVQFVDFMKMGLTIEPELIDFYDDICYYADNHGNLYIIDFSNDI